LYRPSKEEGSPGLASSATGTALEVEEQSSIVGSGTGCGCRSDDCGPVDLPACTDTTTSLLSAGQESTVSLLDPGTQMTDDQFG